MYICAVTVNNMILINKFIVTINFPSHQQSSHTIVIIPINSDLNPAQLYCSLSQAHWNHLCYKPALFLFCKV